MAKYTLIVTEKPEAAKRIAYALDNEGKPAHLTLNGVPYFVAHKDRKLVIVPALGHLFTVDQDKEKAYTYPVFNFKWAPKPVAGQGTKNICTWIEAFCKLSEDADQFVSACDYDIEGCLIGYNILKYACGNKEVSAKRMKFSTLMKKDLVSAYESPFPKLNFAIIESGRTRHEVDWLYGINISRALTLALRRNSGKYKTLSTGRVQGPTLEVLIKREKEICSFVPTPYWRISAEIEIRNSVFNAEYSKKRIKTLSEAKNVLQDCAVKTARVESIQKRTINQHAPLPFDLGTLQSESYRLFSYSPRETLSIAQHLYVKALISYPRTDSHKLPPIIDYRKILNSFKNQPKYKSLVLKLLKNVELKPREGYKEDNAHPAIYPTGNLPEKRLNSRESRIFDLIVRRFMAVFGVDAVKEIIRVNLSINNHGFFLREMRILEKGWMEYYELYVYHNEICLPLIREGEFFRVQRLVNEDRFTSPPSRYNPSSLLKQLECLRIGTKSTRADIIQTLHRRGYVYGKQIEVTELGFDVNGILSRFVPSLVSVKLTRDLEDKMEKIQIGELKRDNVLRETIEYLKSQIETFKEHEDTIGDALANALQTCTQERALGKCPNCGTGNLRIIHSRRTRKRFIGCTNYFKGLCKTSFPLPQHGTLKSSRHSCKLCGWPTVLVWFRSKKPWSLCFNLECSSNRRSEKR